jgi:hypothetical protein
VIKPKENCSHSRIGSPVKGLVVVTVINVLPDDFKITSRQPMKSAEEL